MAELESSIDGAWSALEELDQMLQARFIAEMEYRELRDGEFVDDPEGFVSPPNRVGVVVPRPFDPDLEDY